MKFSIHKNELELRSCNSSLTTEGEHTTAEIVKWHKNIEGKSYCYTLAFWSGKESDEKDLTVLVRAFEPEIGSLDFIYLAKLGFKLLGGDEYHA